MAEIVRMPRLSDTMTEGTVAKWHKKVGDAISEGDLLAEIETDKATMEFESFQEGVLLHIGVGESETAAVDCILAILGDEGEDVKALIDADATPQVVEVVEEKVSVPETKVEATPIQNIIAPIKVTKSTDGRIVASPLAKRLAEEKGLDITSISGSGDGGRVIKRDVDNYQAPVTNSIAYQESYTEESISQMRKVILLIYFGRYGQCNFGT
jgi:pyruvate dehydrogenase E2 component (dihydrolipoamide acetyltransferase)